MTSALRRRISDEPVPGDRLTWFLKSSATTLAWPITAAVLALPLLSALPGQAVFAARSRSLTVFWFLALFLVVDAMLRAFLQVSPRRRQLRRIIVPTVLILAVLDHLTLLGPITNQLSRPLPVIASSEISALSLLVAGFIGLGFLIGSRGIGDLVGNRILPQLGFETALSDALGAVLRYVFVIVGALSIGIGFGLQNIVNNFVSGLILMFERTIKRGDIIELAGIEGRVLSIGLRSSVVRTRAGRPIHAQSAESFWTWRRLTRRF